MLSEQELLDIANIPFMVESLNIDNKENESGFQIYRKSDGKLLTHEVFRSKGWAERHLIDTFAWPIKNQFMETLKLSYYKLPPELSIERGTVLCETLFDQFEIRKT